MRYLKVSIIFLIIFSAIFSMSANAQEDTGSKGEDACCLATKELAMMLKDIAYLFQGTEIARNNIYVRQRCQEIMDRCAELLTTIKH